MKRILFVLSLLLLQVAPVYAVNPCNPTEVKPQKTETRLGTISVAPDIVPVGELMTIMVNSAAGNLNITITPPPNTEITDYFPKENYSSVGKWTGINGALPEGQYQIIVKSIHWTAGKWAQIYYSITNQQGLGEGHDYYFSYYDTVSLTIALDDRNMAPQSTRDVVRKVEVTAAADLQITLTADKGDIGSTISQKMGKSVTAKADSRGIGTFYLFAKEGDNVKLTATSPDTCQMSTATQTFSISRSDVARTFTDYSWLWWALGTILLIFIIIILTHKKHTQKQPEQEIKPINPNTPKPTTETPPGQNQNETLNDLNNKNDQQPPQQ